MSGLQFFDCNLMVGRPGGLEAYQVWRTEDILATLARCGIRRAMASGVEALEYHPLAGNAALSALCKETEALQPVWTLLPGQTGEFPQGAALWDALDQNGVRLVRLWPSASRHNFSLSRWCSGELLDVLRDKQIPVLLDAGELSWDALDAFLSGSPALPVVLTGLTYRMDRVLYPLLERHGDLYLETSGLKGFLSIEDLCRRFGAGRLLFGSGMPVNSAGAAVAMVEAADISREEKERIAHENLETLLSGVI